MDKKRLVIGVSGASGIPITVELLKEMRRHEAYETWMILTRGARMTIPLETEYSVEEFGELADHLCDVENIGDGPASGTFLVEGMVIVPCSMKTVAGICSGYSDNLLLRVADVTIKEQRRLVLATREMPLSPIHLRNLRELAAIPGVTVMPPMLTYYHCPKTLEDVTRHVAGKLLGCFGIEMEGYKRWKEA